MSSASPNTRFPSAIRFLRWALCGLLVVVCSMQILAQSSLLTEEEYETNGRQFAALLSKQKIEPIIDLFDLTTTYETITEGLDLDERRRILFRDNYRANVLRSLRTRLSQCDSARFLGVQWVDNERRILIRLQDNATTSYYYLGFTLARDEFSGGIKIIDLYDYLAGEAISQTTRGMLVDLLAVQKQAIKDKAPELVEAYLENADRVEEASRLMVAHHDKEVLEILRPLPDSWKKLRYVLALRFMASQQVDHDECQRVAQDWAQAFPGDPSLDLVLSRTDELLKKYADAIRHIDALRERIEEDSYLIYLKAELCLKNNDLEGANTNAWKVLEKDPSLDQAWLILVKSALLAKDHPATFVIVKKFRRKYSPDSLTRLVTSEPRYAEAFREFSEYLKSTGKE